MTKVRLGLLMILLLLLCFGCTHAISPQLRKEAGSSPPFTTILTDPNAYIGKTVVWGGQIIETVNQPTGTSLIVLETPLKGGDFPRSSSYSQGRFIARTDQYLDPAVYNKRRITIAGDIIGKEIWPVGQVQYAYPVVRVKEINLWEPHHMYPYPYPYWEWEGPWGWWGAP